LLQAQAGRWRFVGGHESGYGKLEYCRKSRIPQDGRIALRVACRESGIFAVSTMPRRSVEKGGASDCSISKLAHNAWNLWAMAGFTTWKKCAS